MLRVLAALVLVCALASPAAADPHWGHGHGWGWHQPQPGPFVGGFIGGIVGSLLRPPPVVVVPPPPQPYRSPWWERFCAWHQQDPRCY